MHASASYWGLPRKTSGGADGVARPVDGLLAATRSHLHQVAFLQGRDVQVEAALGERPAAHRRAEAVLVDGHAIDADEEFAGTAGLVERVGHLPLAKNLVEVLDGLQVAGPQAHQGPPAADRAGTFGVHAGGGVDGHALGGGLEKGLRAGRRTGLAQGGLGVGVGPEVAVLGPALAADGGIDLIGLQRLEEARHTFFGHHICRLHCGLPCKPRVLRHPQKER